MISAGRRARLLRNICCCHKLNVYSEGRALFGRASLK
jgi:hypothetical protein